MKPTSTDELFMRQALEQASIAMKKGEVPIGAVIVGRGKVIAKGYNLTETLTDVTAHAEMQAISSASENIGGKYLQECTLYVTLEPCQMCAGALYWSQISRVVFGANDPKRGYRAMGAKLHPKTEILTGVLAPECEGLINDFFKRLR